MRRRVTRGWTPGPGLKWGAALGGGVGQGRVDSRGNSNRMGNGKRAKDEKIRLGLRLLEPMRDSNCEATCILVLAMDSVVTAYIFRGDSVCPNHF